MPASVTDFITFSFVSLIASSATAPVLLICSFQLSPAVCTSNVASASLAAMLSSALPNSVPMDFSAVVCACVTAVVAVICALETVSKASASAAFIFFNPLVIKSVSSCTLTSALFKASFMVSAAASTCATSSLYSSLDTYFRESNHSSSVPSKPCCTASS